MLSQNPCHSRALAASLQLPRVGTQEETRLLIWVDHAVFVELPSYSTLPLAAVTLALTIYQESRLSHFCIRRILGRCHRRPGLLFTSPPVHSYFSLVVVDSSLWTQTHLMMTISRSHSLYFAFVPGPSLMSQESARLHPSSVEKCRDLTNGQWESLKKYPSLLSPTGRILYISQKVLTKSRPCCLWQRPW